MKLKSSIASFELKILGYEYEKWDNVHDANWLIVEVRASIDGNEWRASCACLRTFELVELRRWLANLPTDQDSSIAFAENELSFSYRAEAAELAVVLDFRFHPKGALYDYVLDREVGVSFAFHAPSISKALIDLDGDIARFPMR